VPGGRIKAEKGKNNRATEGEIRNPLLHRCWARRKGGGGGGGTSSRTKEEKTGKVSRRKEQGSPKKKSMNGLNSVDAKEREKKKFRTYIPAARKKKRNWGTRPEVHGQSGRRGGKGPRLHPTQPRKKMERLTKKEGDKHT